MLDARFAAAHQRLLRSAGPLLLLLGACAVHRAPVADAASAAPPAAWIPGFVANVGQWPAHVLAAPVQGPDRLWLEADSLAMQQRLPDGRAQVIRLRLPSAGRLATGKALPHRVSFLRGDTEDWQCELATHASVHLRELAPGVALGLRFAGDAPEYYFELADAASLAAMTLHCEGIDSLRLLPDGQLELRGPLATLRQQPPSAFQRSEHGELEPVPVRVELRGELAFGFAVAATSAGPLLLDPVLQWASYAGGSGYEWGYAAARGPDGSVAIGGETMSTDFPTTSGVVGPNFTGGVGPPTTDGFVARFNANGNLLYATYLGGSSGEKILDLAIDSIGSVYVVGSTQSANFPTTQGAFQRTRSGGSDGFVLRLNPSGSALLFSTLLGGDTTENIEAIALAPNGECWVAGVTSSASFPTTAGAFQRQRAGTSDAFAARLAADGSALLACTLLGGASGDVAKGIAIASDGSAYFGGVTSSSDFPTTASAFQRVLRGNGDGFVARISSDATTLLASTLCGGSSGETGEAVALQPGDLPVFAGVTSSSNFPVTPGAFQTNAAGNSDAFVVGFAPDLSTLRFATLCGGSSSDVGKGLVATSSGTLLLGGQSSGNFPSTPEALVGPAGNANGFVAHLAADGSGLLFGTLVGGSGSDGGEALGGYQDSVAVLVGVTGSSNFPVTPGAWSSSQRGTNDAFVACIDAAPGGLLSYGLPSPNCGGSNRISANRRPDRGAADFALLCHGAPPLTFGMLAFGFAPAPGLPLFGILAHVDPNGPLFTLGVFSDTYGSARAPLSLVGVPTSTRIHAQYFWLNPPTCGSPSLLSASDGLQIDVQ